MQLQQDNREDQEDYLVRAEMEFHMKNGLEIKLPINLPYSQIDSLKQKLTEGLSESEKPTDYLVMQGSSNNIKDFFILPRSAIICVEFRIKCILDSHQQEPQDLSWKQKFKKLKTTLITMLRYVKSPLI